MRSLNSAKFFVIFNNIICRFAIECSVIGLIIPICIALILPLEAQDTYGTISDFTLTTSENSAFKKNEMQGKIWLAHTFFTSCPSVCPTIIADIKNLISGIPEKDRPSVMSITVNPQTDSIERLTDYRIKRGLKDYNWKLLTGSQNEIDSFLENGLRLPGTEGNPDAHSPRIVLIDKESQIRGYYLATDQMDLKRLKDDLFRLI